jgi:2-iminobutanoate/2-iminopropanoate deaminase
MKQAISTPDAPSAPTFLSQALVCNDLIFLSGQIHTTADNQLVGNTPAEKLEQIMSNIKAILKAAGADLSDVVKVVIYVTDMAQMAELNAAYPSHFSQPYPVREAVCVQALPLGATIEVSVTATRK